MLVIAVTGGIGSGKSTVANLFKAKGIPIIDTDEIARQLVAPGTPLLKRIIDEFGPTYLDEEGRLRRRALRDLIFDNSEARQQLEQMSHPLIYTRVKSRLAEIHAPYCLLIIPLLARSKQQYPYDRVLLVTAAESERVQRTCLRDQQAPDAITRIIASQASEQELSALADDIIDNSGDLQDLQDQVDQMHQQYLDMSTA